MKIVVLGSSPKKAEKALNKAIKEVNRNAGEGYRAIIDDIKIGQGWAFILYRALEDPTKNFEFDDENFTVRHVGPKKKR